MKKILIMIFVAFLNLNLLMSNDMEQSFNSISFQPLGFIFSWSNIEYERMIGEIEHDFILSVNAKFLFSTHDFGVGLLYALPSDGQWLGLGIGAKVYNLSNEFYFGFDYDFMSSPEKQGDNFSRLSLEIGEKYFISGSKGFYVCLQLVAYIFLTKLNGLKKASGYPALSIGYQF